MADDWWPLWPCKDAWSQFVCAWGTCGNTTEMFTVQGGSIEKNAAFDSALSSTSSAASTNLATPSETQHATASVSTSLAADRVCPSHIGAHIGLGVGLGVPLLIALISLVTVLLQLQRYKKNKSIPWTGDYSSQQQALWRKAHRVLSNLHSPRGYNPFGQTKAELPSVNSPHPRTESDGNEQNGR